jgi:predicted Rossmann-fold nucleotide-binding protein
MPEFEGRFAGNVVDKEIKTANYIERMFGLMDQADAFICFQGGTGTLSEWTTAWLLAHLYYGNHKPLILYGEFWHKVMDVISEHFFIGQTEQNVYAIANNEQELIALLEKFENELADRCGLPPKGDFHSERAQKEAAQAQTHPIHGRAMHENVVKKTVHSLLHRTKHGFAQKGKFHLKTEGSQSHV